MKQLLTAMCFTVLLTACHSERVYTKTSGFENLPLQVQDAVRHEIGNAKIISAQPATVAGIPGYYQVDCISQGMRKSLKVDEHATYLAKSDWGYVVDEAAGAQNRR